MAKTEMGLDEILTGINERIELLVTIKAAVRYAFTGESEDPVEVEFAPEAKQRTRKTPKRAARTGTYGKGREMFLAALAQGPLSANELFTEVQSRGWQTASKHPRNQVPVVLHGLLKAGLVTKQVDGKWVLVGYQPATEAAAVTAAA